MKLKAPKVTCKVENHVAPSTSGAANGYWDESVWRDLGIYYNNSN